MIKEDQILELIYLCIDEHNSQSDTEHKLLKTKETILFGKTSPLDSLGLVSLLITIEQVVNERLDMGISLADERAMSQNNSPFRNVESLSKYLLMLVEENRTSKKDG